MAASMMRRVANRAMVRNRRTRVTRGRVRTIASKGQFVIACGDKQREVPNKVAALAGVMIRP
jgi:hypothetical protein